MIKSLPIKEISIYLSLAGSILLWVYNFGSNNAVKDLSTAKIEKNVNILLKSDTAQIRMFQKFDSILNVHLLQNNKTDKEFKTLIQNYSNFVQANTKTVQEWKEYMNGLTFEIVQDEPMKSVFPNPKIKITPIKK